MKKGNNNIVLSKDGSHTMYSSRFEEHYHSLFGAIQESKHIFIKAGLEASARDKNSITILEIGFGTGLNALLTFQYAQQCNLKVNYVAVEPFPITTDALSRLNYPELLNIETGIFRKMHKDKDKILSLKSNFNLTVFESSLQSQAFEANQFNLVYFDAFSPDTQPEMWKQSCFEKIFIAMKLCGILTTYSCKGSVKRALKSAGFDIEKLPGPPGKREFLRATKK